jgi:hypothetical protein
MCVHLHLLFFQNSKVGMKKISGIIFLCFLVLLMWQRGGIAKTTVAVTSPGGEIDIGTETVKFTQQFEDELDLIGPIFADAFAFSNTLGYPIGKAYIGTFPHMEFGVSLGTGLTNMESRRDDHDDSDGTEVLGVAPAPSLHFGFGLGMGFDVIGKIFVYDFSMYDPEVDYKGYELRDFRMYSFGGRIRYNWLKDAVLVPFLLHFGGLTFSLGADYMRGNLEFGGDYDTTFEDIVVTPPGTAVPVDFSGAYVSKLKWYQLSLSLDALAYFDILYVLTFYTGVGCSVGYGWFTMEFDAAGDLDYSGTNVGSATMTSENKYNPQKVIPTYTAGLEVNILVMKINAETKVNLRNKSDISVLIGTRLQF